MQASRTITGLFVLTLLAFVAFVYYWWGWSERFLGGVRVGMSRSQVETLVGPPPQIRRDAGAETWDYTRSWSRDARVYFNTNGVVWAVETD